LFNIKSHEKDKNTSEYQESDKLTDKNSEEIKSEIQNFSSNCADNNSEGDKIPDFSPSQDDNKNSIRQVEELNNCTKMKTISNHQKQLQDNWIKNNEEKENDSDSNSETIEINSDQEEQEYFKTVAKYQENQNKTNFLIKLNIQNKDIKRKDLKICAVKQRSKLRGKIINTQWDSEVNCNISNKSKRRNTNKYFKINNKSNKFKKKILKNKLRKEYSEREDRIITSTSGTYERTYGIHVRMQQMNRKSLKSAHPEKSNYKVN